MYANLPLRPQAECVGVAKSGEYYAATSSPPPTTLTAVGQPGAIMSFGGPPTSEQQHQRYGNHNNEAAPAATATPLLPTLDELIHKASRLYAEGRVDEALQLYDQLVGTDPSNNVLRANYSAILLKLGRVEEAVAEAECSVELGPQWAKAHYRLAEALRHHGDAPLALSAYGRAISLGYCDGSEETSNKDKELFIQAFRSCASTMPCLNSSNNAPFETLCDQTAANQTATSHLILTAVGQHLLMAAMEMARANVKEKKHLIDTAIELLTWVADTPANSSLSSTETESMLESLASAYWMRGEWGQAIMYMELLIERSKDADIDKKLQFHLHIADLAIHDPYTASIAIEYLEKAILLLSGVSESAEMVDLPFTLGAFHPACLLPALNLKLAEANLLVHNHEKAETIVDQQLSQLRESITTAMLEGSSRAGSPISHGKFRRTESLDLIPAAWLLKSRCQLGRGDAEGAVETVRKHLLGGSSHRLLAQVKVKGAEGVASSSEQLNQNILAHLADCHMALEDWTKAEQYARLELGTALDGEVNKLVGSQLHPLTLLAQLYGTGGKWEEAIRLAEEALRLTQAHHARISHWRAKALTLLGSLHLGWAKTSSSGEKLEGNCFNSSTQVVAEARVGKALNYFRECEEDERRFNSLHPHQLPSLPGVVAVSKMETHMNLAAAYRELGGYVEAKAQLEQAKLLLNGSLKPVYSSGAPLLLRVESRFLEEWAACIIFPPLPSTSSSPVSSENTQGLHAPQDANRVEQYSDHSRLEEAKQALEDALMLVQELGDTRREAQLCEKLGLLYADRLGDLDGAITYLQQFLSVARQLGDIDGMMRAYQMLAVAHTHSESEENEEAIECRKSLAALAQLADQRRTRQQE